MNSIPFMEAPTLEELLKYSSIPCYEQAKTIVFEETKMNNRIILAGDAAGHPSQTYVIIDFAEEPKGSYADLKIGTNLKGSYQYLMYSDNKGALQINFGRRK